MKNNIKKIFYTGLTGLTILTSSCGWEPSYYNKGVLNAIISDGPEVVGLLYTNLVNDMKNKINVNKDKNQITRESLNEIKNSCEFPYKKFKSWYLGEDDPFYFLNIFNEKVKGRSGPSFDKVPNHLKKRGKYEEAKKFEARLKKLREKKKKKKKEKFENLYNALKSYSRSRYNIFDLDNGNQEVDRLEEVLEEILDQEIKVDHSSNLNMYRIVTGMGFFGLIGAGLYLLRKRGKKNKLPLEEELKNYYNMNSKEKMKYLKKVYKKYKKDKSITYLSEGIIGEGIRLFLSKSKISDASTLCEYAACQNYRRQEYEKATKLYFRAIDICLKRPGKYHRKAVAIASFVKRLLECHKSEIPNYQELRKKADNKEFGSIMISTAEDMSKL